MQVDLRLGGLITVNGHEIALGQSHALLEAVAQERSVRGAAERLGLSYRAAWGRLVTLDRAFGRPVVAKTKGHGSVLTETGIALRDALSATLGVFEVAIVQEERTLARRLAALAGAHRRDSSWRSATTRCSSTCSIFA